MRKNPIRNSKMIMSRAAIEQRSKPAKPNENIYNSKLSIDESFANAERAKNAPKIILTADFKITPDNLHI